MEDIAGRLTPATGAVNPKSITLDAWWESNWRYSVECWNDQKHSLVLLEINCKDLDPSKVSQINAYSKLSLSMKEKTIAKREEIPVGFPEMKNSRDGGY